MKALVIYLLLITIVTCSVMSQDIHTLARKGDTEKIMELLKKDSTLFNSTDGTGYTSLHLALIRAKWDLAESLIGLGAAVNIAGTEGGTPLHCASNHDHAAIINLLKKRSSY